MSYNPTPVTFISGINPNPDETNQNTRHIINSNNVRFRRNAAEKFGGHRKITLDGSLDGCKRSMLTFERDNVKWQMVGTDTKLYAVDGGLRYNITPLKTVAAATLGTNPVFALYDSGTTRIVETTNGSATVKVDNAFPGYIFAGDRVTLSGFAGLAVGGIAAATFNGTFTIISVDDGAQTMTIRVAATATSNDSRMYGSVTEAFKKVGLLYTGHNVAVGDRIKVLGCSGAVGGVPAAEINGEKIVTVVYGANRIAFSVDTNPTGDTAGGGAAVQVFKEIDAGECDAVVVTGPGIGVPGLGLPGSIQTDTSLFIQPRIWWQDVFGDTWVGGVGQGGKCYQWLGDTETAPTVITNAPDADWGWVEDAKLVTLLGNRIKNSDTGDITAWTPGAASSAYEDDKEDANKLIARCYVNGENLIFDDSNRVFSMRWVGGSVKWVWKRVSNNISIASPNSCIEAGNIAYVQATDNFYYYTGGLFTVIPNNTILKYVLQNINSTQRYKCFVWYNHRFNEVWFHYPSASNLEPDRVAIFNIAEGHWTKREDLIRTAADRYDLFDYPVLSGETYLYQHEIGYDDDNAAMAAWMQVAYAALANGKVLTSLTGMEPDLIQTGDMTIELYGKDRAKDDGVLLESFTLPESGNIIEGEHETRWRSWLYRSNELGGFFRTGGMREFIQVGSEF